jgi:hypothetical protein
MSRTGITLLVVTSTVMIGCTGHLDFDPTLLDASAGQIVNPGNQGTGGRGNGNNGMGTGGSGNTGTGGAGGDPYMPPPPPPPPPDAQPPTMWADAGAGGAGGTAGRDAGAPPPDMAPAAPTCPTTINVLTDVFSKKCGACHGAAAPAMSLDLVTMNLGTRTVNKPAACGGKMLLNTTLGPNNKATGMLIDKLSGAPAGCGVQMPAGAPPLSAAEMACVNDWAIGAINKALGR